MKPLPPELEAKIDEIRSWMFPVGSRIRIAEKARVTSGYVSQVLNKEKFPTPSFLEAAIEVMNENKARFDCMPKMKVA